MSHSHFPEDERSPAHRSRSLLPGIDVGIPIGAEVVPLVVLGRRDDDGTDIDGTAAGTRRIGVVTGGSRLPRRVVPHGFLPPRLDILHRLVVGEVT
ncbi:hypothetical protein IOD13_01695 [Brevibacterium casei]|nr:hypothetical protein [Brevibacterium casei]